MAGVYDTTENWEYFEIKAKELIASGYSNVSPADAPRDLIVGYMFKNAYEDTIWLRINIKDIKHTASEDARKNFTSEKGRLAIIDGWRK